MILNWTLAILALSFLIIVHEAGHFVAAKIGGMHVDRFSVLGIGPPILKLFTYKGTEYVISAIPFGAYVHIVGMEAEDDEDDEEDEDDEDDEEDEEDADDEDSMGAAKQRLGDLPPPSARPLGYRNFRDSPIGYRMFALAGGPLANYITAMLLMIGVFGFVGVQTPTDAIITGFQKDSPAQAAGLKVEDSVLKIGDDQVQGTDNAVAALKEATGKHLGETVDVTVMRDGAAMTVPVTLGEKQPALSVVLKGSWMPVSPVTAVVEGAKWPWLRTAEQLGGLWKLITRQQEGKVGGPVAIARAIKSSADRGVVDFIVFCALISTVLGMFNLLPMPALDGGRLVFQIYELILRRPPNKLLEERVHTVGMIGLLGLLVYATFGDIRNGNGTPRWTQAVNAVKAEVIEAQAQPQDDPEATPSPDPR